MTVKDHSERRPGDKHAYDHLSCASRNTLFIWDANAGANLSQYYQKVKSVSGKTIISDWNFDPTLLSFEEMHNENVRYAINEKILHRSMVHDLTGDYEVLDIHAVNMARIERSTWQLTNGNKFTITTEIPSGKSLLA